MMCCLMWTSSLAQNSQGQSVVSFNIGYSVVGNLLKSSLEVFEDVKTSSIPTLGLTYDYAITDLFSLGVAASYQSVSAEFTDTYLDENSMTQTDFVKASFARMNFAIRPLIHYGGTDELDLYSGLRIGTVMWNSSYESSQDDFDFEDADLFNGSRVSVGLVLFGMRYFFTDNIGINFDVQIGAPYIMSGGISAKF